LICKNTKRKKNPIHAIKAINGIGGMAPLIHNLTTSLGFMVSHTLDRLTAAE
jgi:hypothetical protein